MGENSSTLNPITTAIAAISAAWIAAQGKFELGKKSVKFGNAATTYDLLVVFGSCKHFLSFSQKF